MATPTPTPQPLATIPSCQSLSPENFTFDQDLATDMLFKCMIQTNRPIESLSSTRFTRLIQETLQPEYKGVSETDLKNLAFKYYLQAKKDLIKYFENFQGKVSLTIHAWKTINDYNIPHHCIICHWIDPETWKMSKRIIALEQFQDVYGIIMWSVKEYKLKDKIMSISSDESSYYTTTIEKLKLKLNPMFNGAFFHTKCACHLINSMVQSIFEFAAPIIKKFQDLFCYVFRSAKTKKFMKFVISKGENFIDILAFFPDDWNTVSKTFGCMLRQKSLIVEFYDSCGLKDIEDKDWETINSLLGILKVFHGSVLRLSDAPYPTTPLVLGEILLISHMFKEYKKEPFWEQGILEMESKLLKYYETMMPIFTCAAALNPKIGINGVENILEDIEGYLGLDNMNDNAKVSMAKFSDALHEVFDYYDKMCKSRSQERNVMIESESGSRDIIMESVLRKKSRNMTILNELEVYKRTDFLNVMSHEEYENCNMLEWWRNKGRYLYPILGEMARDLLTVQASSMSLEYGFCMNGRVLEDLEAWKLKPRWEEMRMFLKEHFDDNEDKENVIIEDDDESEEEDAYDDYLSPIKEELFESEDED